MKPARQTTATSPPTMDYVKIATQIVLKVAVIEAATMDAVVVEVVLAEVDAATVMTATPVASQSMHQPMSPTRLVCADLFLSQ